MPKHEPTLLDVIEAFLKRYDMPPSRFGTEALRDPNFVLDLRQGREPRRRQRERARDFMNRYCAQAAE
jgi:hypothetical protein